MSWSAAAEVDLDGDSRTALEIDAVLEWIAGHARSAAGEARVRGLRPSADLDRIDAELDAVEELRRLLAGGVRLLPRRLPDPAPALAALAVAGHRAGVEALRGLADVLLSAAEIERHVEGLEADVWPALRRLAAGLPDLEREARRVLEGSEPDGRLTDAASPALARLRAARQRASERLRSMLERFVRDPDREHVVRDEFVTQRNGRWVVPVRTDAPSQVRGIVHAASSSGRTLFVEPLESVDLNNEIVRLGEDEREEEVRIVEGWCAALRARLDEAHEAVAGVARIDAVQARAIFAGEIDAVRPRVEPGGPLHCLELRHPLLDRHLRSAGSRCVPLDLSLDPADRVLVLSGPNTGGKTVTLKTFGLAVLMAQSGIPVPATAVRLPLFVQVRADIGDHQSIDADLSTFSAHTGATVGFLAGRRAPALFLFDEIGTGTEPAEGAALAQAVLEELCEPGLTTMATTHQGALKGWAFTAEGAACAAMEFDEATLRPTFRILMGAAGASAGLSIARRLGMPERVIERAALRLGDATGRSEALMTRLRELTAEVERRRDEMVRREAELERVTSELAQRAERHEQRRREEAASALDRAVDELRRAMRRELSEVADERERRRLERKAAAAEGRVRGERDRLAGEIAPDAVTGGGGWRVPERIAPGLHVLVRGLGREGDVLAIDGDRVEVMLGSMPFTVERSDLRVPADVVRSGSARGTGAQRRSPVPRLEGSSAAVAADEVDDVPPQLMLVGQRVEEALEALDRYLDAATVAGRGEVRIVHGHGTGRLRSAVRGFLRGHVHVAGFRAGGDGEGGDGATVVTLR